METLTSGINPLHPLNNVEVLSPCNCLFIDNSEQLITMPFEKGKSGNPGKEQENKQLAQDEFAAAIKRLAYWRDSEEARASVAASVALLVRGLGKPAQAIENG